MREKKNPPAPAPEAAQLKLPPQRPRAGRHDAKIPENACGAFVLWIFSFQPEPTPPLAVRYLMGWASQPYGLAQQSKRDRITTTGKQASNATVASMFPGLK
jgi:hypothetical protein